MPGGQRRGQGNASGGPPHRFRHSQVGAFMPRFHLYQLFFQVNLFKFGVMIHFFMAAARGCWATLCSWAHSHQSVTRFSELSGNKYSSAKVEAMGVPMGQRLQNVCTPTAVIHVHQLCLLLLICFIFPPSFDDKLIGASQFPVGETLGTTEIGRCGRKGFLQICGEDVWMQRNVITREEIRWCISAGGRGRRLIWLHHRY